MGLFSKKNKKPCCICGSEKGLMPSIEGEIFVQLVIAST